jgi:hypothetical protein
MSRYSSFFNLAYDMPEVQQYCHDTCGYHYPSATGTLNTAVEEEWVVKDDKSSPMRYTQSKKLQK